MSLTFGFFNSLNHDRLYDANQFSELFTGLITDGVYEMVGDAFMVSENNGMTVNVGIGRAYFNSRWIKNDALMPVTIGQSSQVLNRYDAVVIEVDESTAVRKCFIKVIRGPEAVNPVKPTMIDTHTVHQYPLAYIYVGANVTSIKASNITNAVGTSECPFVTGIIQQMTIDQLVQQWQGEWIEWKMAHMGEFDDWEAEQKEAFHDWFEDLQNELDEHQAANLQNQINHIREFTKDEVRAMFHD